MASFSLPHEQGREILCEGCAGFDACECNNDTALRLRDRERMKCAVSVVFAEPLIRDRLLG